MFEEPFHVKSTVVCARRVAIAKKIIEAVRIELAGYDLSQIRRDLGLFPLDLVHVLVEEDLEPVWQIFAKSSQSLTDLGRFVHDNLESPPFVALACHFFKGVRERSVAQIVEERSCQDNNPLAVRNASRTDGSDPRQKCASGVHHPNRVRQSAVVSAGKNKLAQPQLLDSSEGWNSLVLIRSNKRRSHGLSSNGTML